MTDSWCPTSPWPRVTVWGLSSLSFLPQATPKLVTISDALWTDAFSLSFTRRWARSSRRTSWPFPNSKERAAFVAAHPAAPASSRSRGTRHPRGLTPFWSPWGSPHCDKGDIITPGAGWDHGRKHHDGQSEEDEKRMDIPNCFPVPFSSTALLRSVSHSTSSHFQPGGHSISSLGKTFSPFCRTQKGFQPNDAQQMPKSTWSPPGSSSHRSLGWGLSPPPALSSPRHCRHRPCGSTGLQAAGPGSQTPPPQSSGARRPRRAATCTPGRCRTSGAPSQHGLVSPILPCPPMPPQHILCLLNLSHPRGTKQSSHETSGTQITSCKPSARRQSCAEHPSSLSALLGSHHQSSSAWGSRRLPGDLGAGVIMSSTHQPRSTTQRSDDAFCINPVAYPGQGRQMRKPQGASHLHPAF